MQIDPDSSVPIYRQIADGVRAAIAAGTYTTGEMIPSIRALALELLVNPNTVKRAYDELEREGLVHSVRGRGMFVRGRSAAPARARSRAQVRAAFEQGFDAALAAGLDLDDVDDVYQAVRGPRAGRRTER